MGSVAIGTFTIQISGNTERDRRWRDLKSRPPLAALSFGLMRHTSEPKILYEIVRNPANPYNFNRFCRLVSLVNPVHTRGLGVRFPPAPPLFPCCFQSVNNCRFPPNFCVPFSQLNTLVFDIRQNPKSQKNFRLFEVSELHAERGERLRPRARLAVC
jgi:hypothetical protein